MAFCPNCGTRLNDGAKFCTNCGFAVASVTHVSPVQPEKPVTVREPASQTCEAPAQEYQAPQQSYQAPQQNYQVPQGGYKPPKARKKVDPLAIILPIAGVVLVGIIVLLIVLLGGGKADKNVYGRYNIVAEAAFDYQADTQGEWVELKKGGKGTFYNGYEFKLKWKLDGKDFTGAVTFLGIEEPLNGTLENNLLTATYGDYTMVFLKDGAEMPADFAAPGKSSEDILSDWGMKVGDEGYYYIKSMDAAGVTLTYDDLLMGDMTNAFLWLLSDGTGMIQLAAAEEPVDITWDEGVIHYFGQDLSYTRSGNDITVDFTGGTTMTYSLDFPESNGSDIGIADPGEIDYDLIFALENDWHGLCVLENCTGEYESLNNTYMEMVARFSFNEDGSLVPYLRASIEGQEKNNFQLDNTACYVDTESRAVVLNGKFAFMDFLYPAYFYYNEYDRSINYYISACDANAEQNINLYGTLRLLDDDWTGESYVEVPQGFAEYYEGFSFKEITDSFGLDWNQVPELTHVGENALGIATEGAPTEPASGDDPIYAGWDPDLFDENAAYDLKKLAEVYKWFVSLSYDESHALTYQDFCDKVGGKGKPFHDSCTPEEIHAWWTDAAGSGYLAANFGLDANGNIVYIHGATVGNAANEEYKKIK